LKEIPREMSDIGDVKDAVRVTDSGAAGTIRVFTVRAAVRAVDLPELRIEIEERFH
jgi:hypothetical protein